MSWTVHLANASGSLDVLAPTLLHDIDAAQRRCETVTEPMDLDIVVQTIPGRVIPELGYVGYAPTAHLIHITMDPDNENLQQSMGEPFQRTVAHEANHVLRWRGPGYGVSLGAAMVSEGLAGHFVRELYGNAPEPWEAPRPDDLEHLKTVAGAWDGTYDHGRWFFGSGNLPAWLGYRMGYRLVGAYLAETGQQASVATDQPAEEFRAFIDKIAG